VLICYAKTNGPICVRATNLFDFMAEASTGLCRLDRSLPQHLIPATHTRRYALESLMGTPYYARFVRFFRVKILAVVSRKLVRIEFIFLLFLNVPLTLIHNPPQVQMV
jgi:hypothetical protein